MEMIESKLHNEEDIIYPSELPKRSFIGRINYYLKRLKENEIYLKEPKDKISNFYFQLDTIKEEIEKSEESFYRSNHPLSIRYIDVTDEINKAVFKSKFTREGIIKENLQELVWMNPTEAKEIIDDCELSEEEKKAAYSQLISWKKADSDDY